MIDIILWVVAVVLFLGTAVRWIVLPIAVSWPAWLGFAIGAFAGANHSGGTLPVLLVSGLALAAAAHMANGYRLAVKSGLTGRRVSEEDAEVVTAFRAAGLDRSKHGTGAVQRRETAKPLPRSAGVEQAGRSPVSQVSSSARRPVILPVPPSDRGTLATSGAPRGITDKVAVSSRQALTRVKPSSDPLHDVAGEPPSDAFVECWNAALRHLNSMVQDGIQSWLKAAPTAPFREHLSFRLGNQLFLIRIEDVSGQLVGPNTRRGLLAAADDFGGWPCVMPMTRARDGRWEPARPGWGLVDARNGRPTDPFALVSDEEIEMTNWELHQFAVQVVEQQLVGAGVKVSASQGNLGVDPTIWIERDGGPEWVVVRAAKYPKQRADVPAHWGNIVERCRSLSVRGHFASVSVARADANFAPGDPSPGRLLRGHGMHVRYTGLEEVAQAANGYSVAGAQVTTRQTTNVAQSQQLKAGAAARAAQLQDVQSLEQPRRAVLVIVENWPDGTMAFKFGKAVRDALRVTDDQMQLVQMRPERIFRAVTSVTEHQFRTSLAESGTSVPDAISFVEL